MQPNPGGSPERHGVINGQLCHQPVDRGATVRQQRSVQDAAALLDRRVQHPRRMECSGLELVNELGAAEVTGL